MKSYNIQLFYYVFDLGLRHSTPLPRDIHVTSFLHTTGDIHAPKMPRGSRVRVSPLFLLRGPHATSTRQRTPRGFDANLPVDNYWQSKV